MQFWIGIHSAVHKQGRNILSHSRSFALLHNRCPHCYPVACQRERTGARYAASRYNRVPDRAVVRQLNGFGFRVTPGSRDQASRSPGVSPAFILIQRLVALFDLKALLGNYTTSTVARLFELSVHQKTPQVCSNGADLSKGLQQAQGQPPQPSGGWSIMEARTGGLGYQNKI